jgi:hypothetical protein
MSWSLVLGLAAILCLMAFLRLRTVPTRVQVTNWFIVYPGTAMILLYTWFYSKWVETLLAAALAAAIVAGWWYAYGRGLPAPTSDNITVWGQEAKKPAQAAAEAQAEVERLKEEKEALERELKRLKEEKGSGTDGERK